MRGFSTWCRIWNLHGPGHDLWIVVRDPKIWERQNKVQEKGGGFTVDLLGCACQGLIQKRKIKKHTGVWRIDMWKRCLTQLNRVFYCPTCGGSEKYLSRVQVRRCSCCRTQDAISTANQLGEMLSAKSLEWPNTQEKRWTQRKCTEGSAVRWSNSNWNHNWYTSLIRRCETVQARSTGHLMALTWRFLLTPK